MSEVALSSCYIDGLDHGSFTLGTGRAFHALGLPGNHLSADLVR